MDGTHVAKKYVRSFVCVSSERLVSPMLLIIVRRGALSTFRFLEQSCREISGLRVIWDRRREPRARPRSERRGEVPDSWTAADHVFTRVDEAGPNEFRFDDASGDQRV